MKVNPYVWKPALPQEPEVAQSNLLTDIAGLNELETGRASLSQEQGELRALFTEQPQLLHTDSVNNAMMNMANSIVPMESGQAGPAMGLTPIASMSGIPRNLQSVFDEHVTARHGFSNSANKTNFSHEKMMAPEFGPSDESLIPVQGHEFFEMHHDHLESWMHLDRAASIKGNNFVSIDPDKHHSIGDERLLEKHEIEQHQRVVNLKPGRHIFDEGVSGRAKSDSIVHYTLLAALVMSTTANATESLHLFTMKSQALSGLQGGGGQDQHNGVIGQTADQQKGFDKEADLAVLFVGVGASLGAAITLQDLFQTPIDQDEILRHNARLAARDHAADQNPQMMLSDVVSADPGHLLYPNVGDDLYGFGDNAEGAGDEVQPSSSNTPHFNQLIDPSPEDMGSTPPGEEPDNFVSERPPVQEVQPPYPPQYPEFPEGGGESDPFIQGGPGDDTFNVPAVGVNGLAFYGALGNGGNDTFNIGNSFQLSPSGTHVLAGGPGADNFVLSDGFGGSTVTIDGGDLNSSSDPSLNTLSLTGSNMVLDLSQVSPSAGGPVSMSEIGVINLGDTPGDFNTLILGTPTDLIGIGLVRIDSSDPIGVVRGDLTPGFQWQMGGVAVIGGNTYQIYDQMAVGNPTVLNSILIQSNINGVDMT